MNLARLKPTIAIIEDDAAVRSSLVFLLECCGFPVLAYGSGDELLADGDSHCDCMVIDYHLPAMTGLELIDCLPASRTKAPVVLVT